MTEVTGAQAFKRAGWAALLPIVAFGTAAAIDEVSNMQIDRDLVNIMI
jgi:hypothetical protein